MIPFDNPQLRLNSSGMVHKYLALVLVPSWLLLTALDALTGLDIQSRIQFYGAPKAAASDPGFLTLWINSIVEIADDSETRDSAVLERFFVRPSAPRRDAALKAVRLHKLHRVFLI
jgi:hypothetical protein